MKGCEKGGKGLMTLHPKIETSCDYTGDNINGIPGLPDTQNLHRRQHQWDTRITRYSKSLST